MKQMIAVLDCNNFFVSCERVFRPDIWKKPTLVLSSNDGCVVARSKEVKDIGIPMGVPYFKIKDIVKDNDIAVFSSHFALYRDISRRVFELLREEFDTVEQYSIDEAFFTLDDTAETESMCAKVKQTVETLVGVPVSVGVGFSKTQAKAAVEFAKKSATGVHAFRDDNWQQIIPQLPLADIWGVGANLEMRYKQHGLRTVADLLAADSARIQKLFGVAGARIQRELSGVAVDIVEPKSPRQHSVMSSRSFKETTTDLGVVLDAVHYHVRHVAATLRAQDVGACELSVSIRPSRHSDYLLRGGSKSVTLEAPTNDTFALIKYATLLTEALFETDVPYKKAGVVVSHLRSGPQQQSSLFADTGTSTGLSELNHIIDLLNQKQGRETVTIGDRLRHQAWTTRVDARSPAYTTKWSDIAKARA